MHLRKIERSRLNSLGDENQEEIVPKSIKNRWIVERPISSGSFGSIYQGVDSMTKEKVAIKFEDRRSRHAQLRRESQIYRTIEGKGMPKMYW